MAAKRTKYLSEKMCHRQLLQCAIDNVYEKLSDKFLMLKLNDVSKIDYANPVPTNRQLFETTSDSQIECLDIGNLTDLKTQHSSARISEKSAGVKLFNKLKRWWPKTSDLLTARYYGDYSTFRAPGHFCPWYTFKISSNTSQVCRDFLYFMMNATQVRTLLQNSDSGTGVRFLNKGSLDNLPIPLPPLDVQQQIVDLLEPIEAAANMTWLSTRGFTRVEDLHKDVLQVAIDNVFEKLEETVSKISRVSDIATVRSLEVGFSSYKKIPDDIQVEYDWNNTFPLISIGSLRQKKAAYKVDISTEPLKNSLKIRSKVIGTDELLIDDAYFNVHYSIPGLYWRMLQITADPTLVQKKYLGYMLKASKSDNFRRMNSIGVQGFKRLDRKILEKTLIPIPSLEIQQQIVEYLSLIENSSKTLKSNSTQSSQLIFTET